MKVRKRMEKWIVMRETQRSRHRIKENLTPVCRS